MMWDQIAHVVAGFLVLWPAAHGHYWMSATLIGVVREVTQMEDRRIFEGHPWDWGWGRTTDVFFWFLGGLALEVVTWAI